MERKIKGVLIDIDYKRVSVVEIEDDFRELQKVIRVDWFTIARRRIGETTYTIVCDDEGLLKAGWEDRIGACGKNDDLLVGNLFICRERGEDLESLTQEDIEEIIGNVGVDIRNDNPVVVLA